MVAIGFGRSSRVLPTISAFALRVVVLTLLSLDSATAWASLLSGCPDIGDLEGKADNIVVGTVASVAPGPSDQVELSVRVEHVLRGSVKSGNVESWIIRWLPPEDIGPPSPQVGAVDRKSVV